MDVVDRLTLYANDLWARGSVIKFEAAQGNMFRVPYADLRPIMRSAFQKHIRRGHEYAHRWGHYLLLNDPAYAWSTLYTIVVEDIGLGNSHLSALMALATLKSWRKCVMDDIGLFHGIIDEARTSTKNRSPCELSVLASAIDFTIGKDPTDDDLLAALCPEVKYPSIDDRLGMMTAAHFLRARSRNGNEALLHRCLTAIHDYHATDEDARDALLPFERPVDSMCYGFHALLYKRGATTTKKPVDLFTPVEPYQGLPLASLDQHTEAGRTCLKQITPFICKDLKTDKTYLVEKTLGNILFFHEGCIVDSLQMTEQESQIMSDQQVAYLSKNGAKNLGFVNEAQSAFADRIDTFEQMRMDYLTKQVVKSN